MSIFTNPIRPAPIASDAAVRRYIDAIRRQIEPDPLYRRRLRGEVVNRFVAQKQGVAPDRVRATLADGCARTSLPYASFALGVSVTGVMAASDAAIPGDLHPLKRRHRDDQARVLPEQYRDELATCALSERIGEVGQLVEAGEIARASAFADPLHDAYDQAMAESDDPGPPGTRIDRQVARLEDVMSGLPAADSSRQSSSPMVGAPGQSLDAWAAGGTGPGAEPGILRRRPGPGPDELPAKACPRPAVRPRLSTRMSIRRRTRPLSPTARRARTAGPPKAGTHPDRRCERRPDAEPESQGQHSQPAP